MIKKLFVLLLSIQLSFGFTVTDPTSYVYFMQQIKQTTDMIDNITTQIETLGGIRSSVDDMKRDIYNSKDSLEGAIYNLQNSVKSMSEASRSVEIKSLFSMDRKSIGNTHGGILYENISDTIKAYFKEADEKTIMKAGGKEKFKDLQIKLYTIKKALEQTNLNDFKKVMKAKIDYEQVEKSALVSDYLYKQTKITRQDAQQLSLAQVHRTYNDLFNPTEKQLQDQLAEEKRIESYGKYIENSSSLYQQNKTTNYILYEILKFSIKQYKASVEYRNSIVSLHLKNGNNKKYIELLATNEDLTKVMRNELVPTRTKSRLDELKKSDPAGRNFRF